MDTNFPPKGYEIIDDLRYIIQKGDKYQYKQEVCCSFGLHSVGLSMSYLKKEYKDIKIATKIKDKKFPHGF